MWQEISILGGLGGSHDEILNRTDRRTETFNPDGVYSKELRSFLKRSVRIASNPRGFRKAAGSDKHNQPLTVTYACARFQMSAFCVLCVPACALLVLPACSLGSCMPVCCLCVLGECVYTYAPILCERFYPLARSLMHTFVCLICDSFVCTVHSTLDPLEYLEGLGS